MKFEIDECRFAKMLEAVRAIRASRGGQAEDVADADVAQEILNTVDFRIRQLNEEAAKSRVEARLRGRE